MKYTTILTAFTLLLRHASVSILLITSSLEARALTKEDAEAISQPSLFWLENFSQIFKDFFDTAPLESKTKTPAHPTYFSSPPPIEMRKKPKTISVTEGKTPEETLIETINFSKNTDLNAYKAKYRQLKQRWGIQDGNTLSLRKKSSVFFKEEEALLNSQSSFDEISQRSSELTEEAILALQMRFLIDNPEISIKSQNLENLRVMNVSASEELPNSVKFAPSDLTDVWIRPTLDKFHQKSTKEVYASIIRVTAGNQQNFVVVVAHKDGRVDLIDPTSITKQYNEKILQTCVDGLNSSQTTSDKTQFRKERSTIYTGIQASGAALPSSSIYAFSYWAATLSSQNLDAYKSLNGAYSEGNLTTYSQLVPAAVYSKESPKVTGLQNENRFDESLRNWLQEELHGINH